jgi:hypothetical protein
VTDKIDTKDHSRTAQTAEELCSIDKTPVILQGAESITYVTPSSICAIQVLVETKADVSGKRVVTPVCANQVLQVTNSIIYICVIKV